MKKGVTIASTLIGSLFLLICFGACNHKASQYTEQEHIERVSQRIEERFMTGESNFTDFHVYPLYNQNEELNHMLVEFEPRGFLYVQIRDEQFRAFSCLGVSNSMYKLTSLSGNDIWSPYKLDETNSQPYPDVDKIWIKDENGEKQIFYKSPYCVAGFEKTERLYLIKLMENVYSPAIKKSDNIYLNLISKEEMELIEENPTTPQAYVIITTNPKFVFDL